MAAKKNDNEFFTYKGKPMVVSGNTLYYGEPDQKYILVMQIADTKALQDLNIPTKVHMSLMLTDPNVGLAEKIVKSAVKPSLSSALDVGLIWLDRALKKD